MHIGFVVPVLANWTGLADLLNSAHTQEHALSFRIVDNSATRRSLAESWNLGFSDLFARGVAGIFCANDDVVLHPLTIDNLVRCQQETAAWLASAYDIRTESLELDALQSMVVAPPFKTVPDSADFSCFYLPRATWEQVGEFDTNFYPAYFEDDDYTFRLLLANALFVVTTAAVMYHHKSVTQEKTGAVTGEAYAANEAFFVRKWGLPAHSTPDVIRASAYRTPFNDPGLGIRDCPRLR